ncbi:MAG: GNAT family N-acetyltransferase [Oscillospiraceae bacterium]|nr:GNAT family N-acetyltransferase [Oscillospiraceae bacterium]
MTYTIRKMTESEYGVLEDFLYEAIFIPDGVPAPPRVIVNQPELQVYVSEFGKKDGDIALAAEVDGIIIGSVWVRIMNDYGHIDDETPSFAISLYKEYRNNGIGTALMKAMLNELKKAGYKQASLAVQKENYAVKMYKNVGFITVDENDEEYIMVCKF